MAEIVLQIQIDADLKNAAEKIYNKMGLNLTEAVRLFAQKSVELGTAPFAISTKKNTAFGLLSKYANKNLIPLENSAWESAVSEKYGKKTD
mgnify:FL=1